MKKILVIEDNASVRENLAELLELPDYEVVTAENGKTGVQKALAEKPDLILCDVMMPELDGFGVLRILDNKPETASIPFLFLTAKAEKEDFRRGMNLGADDYITKPFDDVELLDIIEMRLKKGDRMRTLFDGSTESLYSFINEAKGQQALEELHKEKEHRLYRKKETIYEEGTLPRRLFFVSKGKVKITKTNEWGKEYIVDMVQDGQFFGYPSLITNESYTDNAIAMEDTEVALIPKEDFFALLYNDRNLSIQFIKMLASNAAEKEEQLLSLAYSSIRKRVAEALIKLDEQSNHQPLSIRREDLAAIVGTAKESVIRTITDFKHEGLVAIEDGIIQIKQREKLDRLPN